MIVLVFSFHPSSFFATWQMKQSRNSVLGMMKKIFVSIFSYRRFRVVSCPYYLYTCSLLLRRECFAKNLVYPTEHFMASSITNVFSCTSERTRYQVRMLYLLSHTFFLHAQLGNHLANALSLARFPCRISSRCFYTPFLPP